MSLESYPAWMEAPDTKKRRISPLTPFMGKENSAFVSPSHHDGCETEEEERKPRTPREVLQALLTPGTKGSAVSSD